MANSRYEYVRLFERSDNLLLNTWIVVRVDGRGFHRFTARHNFTKPNDLRAIDLMNAAAQAVMTEIPDVVIAYGVSDEYSFVFRRTTDLFERRESKLVTLITSIFTAHYIYLWSRFFPPLTQPLPSFDGRAVCYPTTRNLRDYLCWRQVDCHINNLYNTTFWALIQKGGMTAAEAEKELVGTYSADKNEILFSRFGINYNDEMEVYRKGSVVFREFETPQATTAALDDGSEGNTGLPPRAVSKSQAEKKKKLYKKSTVVVRHVDIIKDAFWEERPWILGSSSSND